MQRHPSPPRLAALACLGLAVNLAPAASGPLLPHLRVAYQYAFGRAYSAAAELPRLRVVDLGPGLTPVDVNDNGVVLLVTDDRQLLRWSSGRLELLAHAFPIGGWAALNEADLAVVLEQGPELQGFIHAYPRFTTSPVVLDLTGGPGSWPCSVVPLSLNDRSELVLLRECADALSPFPPHYHWHWTLKHGFGDSGSAELAFYEYHLAADFFLHQGGVKYRVAGINNYGDTVGHWYADSAVSNPFTNTTTYAYQADYYTLNGTTELDFEPLQVNDARTVIGRTAGPLSALVILDSLGQRYLSGPLQELNGHAPRMSNPDDGLEEIVLGPNYWRRMTERDFTGQPTGRPAPDFWQGLLEDLVPDKEGFGNLRATCISRNGLIAGTGVRRDPQTGETVRHALLLIPAALLTDWNRDGRIDEEDRRHSSRGLPFRFWVNDDDDHGGEARSHADDLPGSANPDWATPGVDGLRDVVDFFPVHLDLQGLLRALGDLAGADLVLRHADEALNFVYTRLRPGETGRIHSGPVDDTFGAGFSQPLAGAATHPITADGVSLSLAFKENLHDENRGVLLLEGRRPTTEPLVLELRYQGRVILRDQLPLSIGPVGDMLRILNLRESDPKFTAAGAGSGMWPTRLGEPPNLPDAWLAGFGQRPHTLVHVHGFNWGADQAPAAHAEIFKRFFQSGANARFIGVTWFGDQGTYDLLGTSLDYNENVINAFITAARLKEALDALPGPFSIFAHSLGNMVASSAIADHGLEALHYFMVNAAVPNEAYLGEQANRRLMTHTDWKDTGGTIPDYPEHLLSTNWHRLLPQDDRRSLLKWKDRFATVSESTLCLNFYSSAEDVLSPGTGRIPSLFRDIRMQERVWVYNEMLKGTNTFSASLTGDVHGGWAFNRTYMSWINPGGPHPPSGSWVPMTTTSASQLDPALLVAEPFFRKFSSGDSDFPAWGDGAWLYGDRLLANSRLPALPLAGAQLDFVKNHAKILAEGVPAHSAPAGATALPSLPLLLNYDLDRLMRDVRHWPHRADARKAHRWLHSDYLNPALSHVSRLYRTCVKILNFEP